MYLLYLFSFICTVFEVSGECCIEIKETGIYPMKPGDVGMVFWLTLTNLCKQKFNVNVKMLQCVEIISESEEETSAMFLIGGYMGTLKGKATLIATLIYPNMYLYNRQGNCVIGILYTDDKHGTHSTRAHIRFNTVPHDGQVPAIVHAFYRNSRSIKVCDTPDLDQLDKCQHVDCMMKYLGLRNYFNQRWKRCQKVPACVSSGMSDEPDVSYVPTSNRCRNLDDCITENDISLLEQGTVSNGSGIIFSSRGLLLRCNKGRIDNSTGICKCREGYTSVDPDIENYLPGLTVYHMCNIKVNSWNEENLPKVRRTALAFSILSVVITMVVLIFTIVCYTCYAYFKSEENTSPFEHSSPGNSEHDLYEGDSMCR